MNELTFVYFSYNPESFWNYDIIKRKETKKIHVQVKLFWLLTQRHHI